MTIIIAVGCAKGGVAKTTTAMQLAGLLTRWGRRAVVLDADNTGGATKWAMTAMDNGDSLEFPVSPVNQVTLNRELIQRQYPDTWVIIDTPPSDTGVIQLAFNAADVIIIPTQPSMMDLRLAAETYRAVSSDSRTAIVLVTRAKLNTRLTNETKEQLDGLEVTRFETVIRDREAVKGMAGTSQLDMEDYSSVAHELIEFVEQDRRR